MVLGAGDDDHRRLALYTALPRNEFAAGAVFLGSVILLALPIWCVAEELRDGLVGLFKRRPREVEVLGLDVLAKAVTDAH